MLCLIFNESFLASSFVLTSILKTGLTDLELGSETVFHSSVQVIGMRWTAIIFLNESLQKLYTKLFSPLPPFLWQLHSLSMSCRRK